MRSIRSIVVCLAVSACAVDTDVESSVVEQEAGGLQAGGLQAGSLQAGGLQGTTKEGHSFKGAIINGVMPAGYQFCTTPGKQTELCDANGNTISSYARLTGKIRKGPTLTNANGDVISSFSGIEGETINLKLVGSQRDSSRNLLAQNFNEAGGGPYNPYARNAIRENNDIMLYKVQYESSPGVWKDLCAGSGANADGTGTAANLAMFLDNTWDYRGFYEYWSSDFTIACTFGTLAKCARSWGYKPWTKEVNKANVAVDLRPFHQACQQGARAQYCGDGDTFTVDGTFVDASDNHGLVLPESEWITSPTMMFSGEALFGGDMWTSDAVGHRIGSISQRRRDDILPNKPAPCQLIASGEVSYGKTYYPGSDVAIDPVGTKHHVLFGNRSHCAHATDVTGARLQADCNYCTQRICDPDNNGTHDSGPPADMTTMARTSCCSSSGSWDSQCVELARQWCTRPFIASDKSWSYTTGTSGANWLQAVFDESDNGWAYTTSGAAAEPFDQGEVLANAAPWGSAYSAGFPAGTSARWIWSSDSRSSPASTTSTTTKFRKRFYAWTPYPGDNRAYSATLRIAAHDKFSVYVNQSLVGSSTDKTKVHSFTVFLTPGRETVIGVAITNTDGGTAGFALDLR